MNKRKEDSYIILKKERKPKSITGKREIINQERRKGGGNMKGKKMA